MRAGWLLGGVSVVVAHLAAGCSARPLPGEAPADGGGPALGAGSDSAGAGRAPSKGERADGGTIAPPPVPAEWIEVAAPPGVAGLVVTDAWAVGPTDVIFTGTIAMSSGYTPRAIRYANGVWSTEVELPGGGWSRPSVAGTAADDIWIVAGDQIHHKDSSGWSRLMDGDWQATVPRPSYNPDGTLGLTRVRAAGRDDIWVVGVRENEHTGGTGFILHRVEGASSVFVLDDESPGSPAIYYDYHDIYIARPDDVWLSGGSDAVGTTMDPAFLYHWDGTAWTIRGHGRWGLVGLWPTGDGGLWVIDPYSWDGNGRIPMTRFEGDRFVPFPIEGLAITTAMSSIWGAAPDDIWVAGEDVGHWDGQSWRVVDDAPAAARPGGGSPSTFVTGDPTSTWLVASGPRFFRKLRTP